MYRFHMWLKPISSWFVLREDGKQLAGFFHMSLKSMTESRECPHSQAEGLQAHPAVLSISNCGHLSHQLLGKHMPLSLNPRNRPTFPLGSSRASKQSFIQLLLSSVYPLSKKVTSLCALAVCNCCLKAQMREAPHGWESCISGRVCYCWGAFVFI